MCQGIHKQTTKARAQNLRSTSISDQSQTNFSQKKESKKKSGMKIFNKGRFNIYTERTSDEKRKM